METKNICSVCAWRATCLKKFSLSGKDIHCADFCRDVTTLKEKIDQAELESDE